MPPETPEDEIARLRAAVEARDAFLAAVAHELRTPIGTMLLHVEGARALAMHTGSDPLIQRIEALGRQMLQFSRRATTLLDVSVLSSGKLRLNMEPDTDFVDVVRNAIELLTPEANRAGSDLTLENSCAVSGTFDRTRLEQIVLNLVGNAIKYGAGKPIVVHVERAENDAILSVRDSGIGIGADDQARIFERFERVTRTVDELPKSGFGVGLWIVRQIVDAMGGTVGMTSSLGEGSVFTVTLPMQRSGL